MVSGEPFVGRAQPCLQLTHELSGILVMRGEYCETGRLGPLPFGIGDPRPVMPETLYLFGFPVG